jgi:hypothetical protein
VLTLLTQDVIDTSEAVKVSLEKQDAILLKSVRLTDIQLYMAKNN